MKITDVQVYYVRQQEVKEQCDSGQDALIVKILTDAGITGIGEVDSAPVEPVESSVFDLVIGPEFLFGGRGPKLEPRLHRGVRCRWSTEATRSSKTKGR